MKKKLAALALTGALALPATGSAEAFACSSDVATRLVQAYCWYGSEEIGHRVIGYARRSGSATTLKFYGPWVGNRQTSAVTIPDYYWDRGYRFYGLIVDRYRG